MTTPRTALVAGGGIAGATTALALQKAGIEPVVLEARPGPADGEGAFLTLGSNGLEALRRLEADGPALDAGFPTPAMTLRSGSGKRLGDVPASSRRPGGAISRTMMRGKLAALLLAEAERRAIRVLYGRRLAGTEPAGERVLARLADGEELEGDLLIGADGIHSVARRAIDPDAAPPRYGGLLNTGGRTRDVRSAAAPGHYELIFGRRASSATSPRRTARSGGSRTCRGPTSLRPRSSARSGPRTRASGCCASSPTTRAPPRS